MVCIVAKCHSYASVQDPNRFLAYKLGSCCKIVQHLMHGEMKHRSSRKISLYGVETPR